MDALLGFEPKLRGPESLVLPLHNKAISSSDWGRTNKMSSKGSGVTITLQKNVARMEGFEPSSSVLETAMLPLVTTHVYEGSYVGIYLKPTRW